MSSVPCYSINTVCAKHSSLGLAVYCEGVGVS